MEILIKKVPSSSKRDRLGTGCARVMKMEKSCWRDLSAQSVFQPDWVSIHLINNSEIVQFPTLTSCHWQIRGGDYRAGSLSTNADHDSAVHGRRGCLANAQVAVSAAETGDKLALTCDRLISILIKRGPHCDPTDSRFEIGWAWQVRRTVTCVWS